MNGAEDAHDANDPARPIRLGTRGSDLARTQSELVAARLRAAGHVVELVIIATRGDATDRPFRELEGKAFFTRELDEALLDRSIDVAVHSLKDLPTGEEPGLATHPVLPRADPRDLLLARRGIARNGELPAGARVGTSSARRGAQLEEAFPGIATVDLRGNVPTRVAKLRRGDYDAIVVAAAGIERLALELSDLDVVPLEPPRFLPAPGQGVLACRVRADDATLAAALLELHDRDAGECARAERLLLERLDGGCSLPLGAWARRVDGRIRLDATLARDGGRRDAHVVAPTPEEAASVAHATLLGRPVVVLTRPEPLDHELDDALRARGVATLAQPAIDFHELPPSGELGAALASAARHDAVAFTSQRAVQSWFHQLRRHGVAMPRVRVAAIGPATAAALRRERVLPWCCADGSGGRALATLLAAEFAAGARVLHPGPLEPEGTLASELAMRGIAVTPLPLYATRARADDGPLPATPLVFVVASPSAARSLWQRPQLRDRLARAPATVRFVVTGATTASQLALLGATAIDVARLPTGAPLLAAVDAALAALSGAPAIADSPPTGALPCRP